MVEAGRVSVNRRRTESVPVSAVERGMSAGWLDRKLNGPGPLVAPEGERLRTKGWRQVRRARTALTGTR